MAYEPKDGNGALFKNDKGDNDKRPDYRGNLMVGGVLYELAGWIKQGKNGPMMSLAAKPKEDRPQQGPAVPQPPADDPLDDSVPF